jgi:hypothetical protein
MERSRSARYFPRFERGWSPFSQASADAQESQDHYTWVASLGTRPGFLRSSNAVCPSLCGISAAEKRVYCSWR